MIQLSEDQKKAHDFIIDSLKAGAPLVTVGGYAGTGKTTLIKEVVKTLAYTEVVYCAFTGKAANVLREKVDLNTAFHCGTIHSLIYRPVTNEKGQIIRWEFRQTLTRKNDDGEITSPDLIIIDEASMIGEDIFKDLKRYHIPILAIGDHGQLPPVKSTFNLMEKPQFKLEHILRQVEGNPIIRLSMMARNGEYIKKGSYINQELNCGVEKITDFKIIYDMSVEQLRSHLMLSGTNNTRVRMNNMIRRRLGYLDGDSPKVGETVICLKNNSREGLFNGLSGEIKKISPHGSHWYNVTIDMGDEFPFIGEIFKHQFGKPKTLREFKGLMPKELGNMFDFGYCITVHKAQGSEADKVILFDEKIWGMDDKEYNRWLYTGITRARKKLIIVGK